MLKVLFAFAAVLMVAPFVVDAFSPLAEVSRILSDVATLASNR